MTSYFDNNNNINSDEDDILSSDGDSNELSDNNSSNSDISSSIGGGGDDIDIEDDDNDNMNNNNKINSDDEKEDEDENEEDVEEDVEDDVEDDDYSFDDDIDNIENKLDENDNNVQTNKNKKKKINIIKGNNIIEIFDNKKFNNNDYVSSDNNDEDDEDEDEDDDEDGNQYLKKFDKDLRHNYILHYHPETTILNCDEISSMTKVVRNNDGIIIDDLHKTNPYLTKYEKAKILGVRAKQINENSPIFINVPENIIDGYLIAELELKEKKTPFIIQRPLPNGGSEYWNISDLEFI